MSRCKDAPEGFQCPFRHKCPHLDGLSTTWALEVYHNESKLRHQLNVLEVESQKRIDELEKTLLERDAKIAQLRLERQARTGPDQSEGATTWGANGPSRLASARAGPR
jgi:hypothetical protein